MNEMHMTKCDIIIIGIQKNEIPLVECDRLPGVISRRLNRLRR